MAGRAISICAESSTSIALVYRSPTSKPAACPADVSGSKASQSSVTPLNEMSLWVCAESSKTSGVDPCPLSKTRSSWFCSVQLRANPDDIACPGVLSVARLTLVGPERKPHQCAARTDRIFQAQWPWLFLLLKGIRLPVEAGIRTHHGRGADRRCAVAQ